MSSLDNRKLKGGILNTLTVEYDETEENELLRNKKFVINIKNFDEDMNRIKEEFCEIGAKNHFDKFKIKIDEAIDYFYY